MPGKSPSLSESLKSFYSHLSARRRWQLLLLIGLMLLGAVAELVSLGAVVPFVTVLADPERLGQNAFVRDLLIAAGLRVEQLPVAVSVVFGVLVIVAALIRLTLLTASIRFSFGIGHDLGGAVFSKTLQRPYSFHVSRNTSEIIAGVNKVQELVGGLIVPLINGLIGAILATSIILTLVAIDPVVALGGAGVFGLSYFAVAFAVRKRLGRVGQVLARTSNERVQAIQEGLGAIRDVILDGSHCGYQRHFTHVDGEFRRAQASRQVLANAPRFLIEAIGMLLLAGFAVIYSATGTGLASLLPVLGVLAVGAQKLMPLIQQIFLGWSAALSSRAILVDLLELLDYEPVKAQGGAVTFRDAIHFRDVSFAYSNAPGAAEVLAHIHLTIRRGEKIGVIGSTGSGKSTLLDILMGLLPVGSGELVIDHQLLTPATTHGWRKHIAHVPQSIFLSDASISENIAFGEQVDQIDRGRVEQVARIAQIHDHIVSLPRGYRTLVGERGVRLSGGQRQRIGIARALYKHREVLVLDEATSALDDATETRVMQGIDQLASDFTVIIIAHRLTTLKNCDRVVELSHGRIAHISTYESLMQRRAEFADDVHHV